MDVDVRALLFGSRLRIAATVLGGLVVVLGGAFLAGFLGVPSVERVDNQFGETNQSVTEIETQLTAHNPNPFAIRLGGLRINYTASMNGIQMASGNEKGIGLGPGNSTVNLTTNLQNERIPEWWVTHIRNGEQTALTIDATVKSSLLGQSARFQPASRSITTDILAQLNSSEDQNVNADLPVVEDPVLVIRERTGSWGEVTATETPIDLTFTIYNPKTQPVVISSIGYNITMNDVHVGQGRTEETVTIPGKTVKEVGFPTVINTQRLDDWWVSHVENNQVTELTIDFNAEVQPPGTDQTVTVPLDGTTYTKTIETDFFGNKAGGSASGGTDGGSDDAGDSDGGTGDGGDATTTTSDGGSDTTTTTTSSDGGSDTTTTTTTDDGVLDRAPVASVSGTLGA